MIITRNLIWVGICLALTIGFATNSLWAEGDVPAGPNASVPKHSYIGAKKCSMCHKGARKGDQAGIWKKSKHSKTFEVLKSAEAAKTAKELGLTKPAYESPECLKCHVTGWQLTAEQKAKHLKPSFKMEDGVQCETCHGAGSAYKKMSVMKSREKSLANGLVKSDKKLCLECHNDTAPSWKTDRYTTKDGKKVGFDYEAGWEKIKHPKPAK